MSVCAYGRAASVCLSGPPLGRSYPLWVLPHVHTHIHTLLGLRGYFVAQWGVNVASRWASRVQSSRVAMERCGKEAALQSLPASQRDCWHSTPLNSGGQMHFWFWWHVPPFWHRSISSSQTLAVSRDEDRQKAQQRGQRS